MTYRFLSSTLFGIAFCLASLIVAPVYAQEGPQSQSSDSVSKPKSKPSDNPKPANEAPIPSEYKKPKDVPKDTPTFRSEATTVTVDV